MFYNLESTELKEVLDFINHNTDRVPSQDIIRVFMNISYALQSELQKTYQKTLSELNSKERAIERLRMRIDKHESSVPVSFNFVELDSVEVARCIIYLLVKDGIYYTNNTVQFLLYKAYCSWLIKYKERLFEDTAQAQEWGPHFWHVSNKLKDMKKVVANYNDWKNIAGRYPDIAEFLGDVVKQYCSKSEREFKDDVLKDPAFLNAKPSIQGEKWGKKLSDQDIFCSRR